MAPEMWAEEVYTKKVDVWAAGVLLWILFTGELPFDGNTERRLVEDINTKKLNFKSKPWVNVTQAAKNFVK